MAISCKNWFLVVTMVLMAALGCNNSDTTTDNQKEQPEFNLLNFGISMTDFMEFEQGHYGEFPVSAYVPAKYTQLLTVENLPDGAQYQNNKITWQPSCDLNYEEGKFHRGYMYYQVRVTLKVKEDPRYLIQKTGILFVHKFVEEEGGKKCGE